MTVPALLIRCHVADYPAWKAVFDEHEPSRRANGSPGGQLFRDAADPNALLVLLAWDDLERARLFVDSDDLREAVNRSGVVGEPDVWFLEEVDHTAVGGATVKGETSPADGVRRDNRNRDNDVWEDGSEH